MVYLARRLATAADLAALPGDVRAEVVRGSVVERGAPSFEHGLAQGTLMEVLRPPFQRGTDGPGGWWLGIEVEIELETHEIYVPDGSGWRRDRVPEQPRGRPIRVRPDWVAEVLSPSNADRDLGPKLAAYHRVGVPHYWVVDPERETLTVHRWAPGGYEVALTARRRDRVRAAPFDAMELDVALFFGADASPA